MPYNYSRLCGIIVEKFGTQSKFSVAMGLSERSISRKLNGRVDWRQSEISKSCELLDIDNNDINKYFFTT